MLNRISAFTLFALLLLFGSAASLASEPAADILATSEANTFVVDAQVFEIKRSELRKIGIDIGNTKESDGILSGEQATTVIQFVESLDKKYAKQISHPKLMVVDGQPAKLTVGGKAPYELPGKSGQTAYVDVGISLHVIATEAPGGRVNLSVDWKNAELNEPLANEQRQGDELPCLKVSQCQFVAETAVGEPLALLGPVAIHQPRAKQEATKQRDDVIVLMSFRATRE